MNITYSDITCNTTVLVAQNFLCLWEQCESFKTYLVEICKSYVHLAYGIRKINSGIYNVQLEKVRWLICNTKHVRRVVFFLLGDSPVTEFYVLTFRNTLSVPSSEVVWTRITGMRLLRYLQWQRFGLKEVWTNWEEEEQGGKHVQVEEQAVEGNSPNWRPVVRQVRKGETAPPLLLPIGQSYFWAKPIPV
jgi:hypothetical protein